MGRWLSWLSFGVAGLIITVANISAVRAQSSGKPLGIVLAAGDIAKCGRAKFSQRQTADLLGREIAAANTVGTPVRVLALGDLAYERGEAHEFNCFHESWGKYMQYLLPVPGNHEYGRFNDAAPYFTYFEGHDKKIVSQNGFRAGYYALNYPETETVQWHLIGLNSRNLGPASPQLDWLARDLDADNHRCVLAFAHYFRFSSGRHGHEPPGYASKEKAKHLKKTPVPDKRMEEAFRMLHASGASLLLSGHDHHYEEFAPQDADGNAVSNGLRSFIVGTGGAPFYNERYEQHWPTSDEKKYQARWHGVLKLELFATHYTWRFVTAANDPAVPAELRAPGTADCNTRAKPEKPS
jgi:hypothetical protein